MSRAYFIILAVLVLTTASNLTSEAVAQLVIIPRTIVLDGRALALVKQRVQQQDPITTAALQTSVRYADKEMTQGPYSVTDKSKVPPSGDKRDYMSQGRYFWPDPTKPDGLPYVRKDGETNPESRGGDEERLMDMVRSVRYLSLAFYYMGDERYATHAVLLLRTWFLDPQKRMNPRLLYAVFVPGVNDGRRIGMLETRHLLEVVDAVQLLDSARSLTPADRDGIKSWFREYVTWQLTNEQGYAKEPNPANIGTWCDAQLAGFSLYVGDLATARRVLESARKVRCFDPIEPDGRQPHELARADAFGYSVFNLEALTTLASVGRTAGIDLWSYRAADGRGMQAAANFLVPFIADQQSWTFGNKTAAGHNDQLVELYRRLANFYGEERYEALVAKLPESTKATHVVELTLVYLSARRPRGIPRACGGFPHRAARG